MEDLLGALLQGDQAGPDPDAGGGAMDPLAQLLQGLSGGQLSQGGASQAGTESAMGGLDMTSLLQGLLGGQGGLSAGTGQAAASGAGGLGDILGAILGGGSPAMQSNSLLAPIVAGLAEKLNLPPQLAQAVVAFVLGKLLGGRQLPGTAETPSYVQPPSTPSQGPSVQDVVRKMNRGQRASTAPSRAASLDSVVQRMNSGQRVRKADVRSTGLAKELAAHTGLDRTTAEASLQEVLNALAGELGTAR
jgi:hypothetical protein